MMVSATLTEIQGFLLAAGTKEGKAAFQKFVPTAQKVYGVRLPQINDLASRYKSEGLSLAIALWEAGSFEERLLSAKLLGKWAKRQPRDILQLVERFSGSITDWAVCDTLGMQSIRSIPKEFHEEVFALSHRMIISSNPWRRRLGIVLLEGFTKNKDAHIRIHALLKLVKGDKEYYVKKAVQWLERNLEKASSRPLFD